MTARPLGPLLTSTLVLFALLLAALQLMILSNVGRAEGQAGMRSESGSMTAPAQPGGRGPDAAPGPNQHRSVKPPADPHPPSRSFRPNDFGPRRSRHISV